MNDMYQVELVMNGESFSFMTSNLCEESMVQMVHSNSFGCVERALKFISLHLSPEPIVVKCEGKVFTNCNLTDVSFTHSAGQLPQLEIVIIVGKIT